MLKSSSAYFGMLFTGALISLNKSSSTQLYASIVIPEALGYFQPPPRVFFSLSLFAKLIYSIIYSIGGHSSMIILKIRFQKVEFRKIFNSHSSLWRCSGAHLCCHDKDLLKWYYQLATDWWGASVETNRQQIMPPHDFSTLFSFVALIFFGLLIKSTIFGTKNNKYCF